MIALNDLARHHAPLPAELDGAVEARRKALVNRMARVGALRLTALADPELQLERGWNG